jgi:two-component system sensor histidine kinase DegS
MTKRLTKAAKKNEAMLIALENERRFVARELHDGLAQSTLQLGLQAGICRKMLERGMVEMLTRELADLEARIQHASAQVREVIADMRPPQLDSQASLLDYLESAMDTHQERGGPLVEFHSHLTQPLPKFSPLQKLSLLRFVQEALLNVRKHAQAKLVVLSLLDDSDNIYLKISDNGIGFDPAEVLARPADRAGAGLTNLQARAAALGAASTIESNPVEGGTEISLTLSRRGYQ